ncbi:flagellar basal body rod protein FlgB [Antarcticirhabdus aurantiaca]|uniref:Flagellar basal body rod protein FlgB n=1 Tax=Antarcticirhabdus aurantiaca TaxID=2606717 RepID=A0ACD4NTT6_9HYPH|nr:flagellar basal body rod protein FlgB [Antarcticirhabdus aurantiaca]WAJ30204.1 flagellar basal body rod protein FlgB [Jeongeuplla avenae]
MQDVYLFGVASRRAEWLSNRQTVVAENVANANTPEYRARDIASFQEAMEMTRLEMKASSPMHLASFGGRADEAAEVREEDSWEVVHSGNSVSLEQEMMKAGEINREYSLNTSVVKSFHRMLLTTLRG